MKRNDMSRSWALLFARLVLGLIFFMAGLWKTFRLGPLEHARKYFLPYSDTFLPIWSLWAVGVVIPFVELVAGALLIIGLRNREASVSLGFVLAVVTFGASIEGAAIRVPHPCHSSACIVVVYIGTAARRRQVFSRLLGEAVENQGSWSRKWVAQ